MKVVSPARTSVPTVVPRSDSLKNDAIASTDVVPSYPSPARPATHPPTRRSLR